MKTRLIIIFFAALSCAMLLAQSAGDDFLAKYQRQVRNAGVAGVGVQTIVDNWIAACPDDARAYEARFSYCFAKSRSTEIQPKNSERYLGQKPVLTLKDSTGRDVNYFQEDVFVDSLFASCLTSIDKALSLQPLELRYHFDKITAMLSYEKDCPDLSYDLVNSLIDSFVKNKGADWTLDNEALPEDRDEVFCQCIGEFCYTFFQVGSPSSYRYFLALSEKMNKLYPKNPVFLDNIGSYWQVAEKNDKKALKYYKKALKLDPQDYAALNNIRLINRRKAASTRP
ncbi:MAG: hypothetical protein PUC96_01285 [Bacteroidales bacterium]|nr:hypothetical protein [Bacteroidales bacterium]